MSPDPRVARKTSSLLNEVAFLKAAVKKHSRIMPKAPAGPGDDAAVRGRLLYTADLLIEDVHFLAGEPPFLLGRKALAVNLSDIAAMGGIPKECLLSIGLPPGSGTAGALILDGFASMAREHEVAWVGGDTVASPRGIVISVALTGKKSGRPMLRKGARAGDGIYVTGPLGGSAIGRLLLNSTSTVRQPSRPAQRKWIGLPLHEAALRMLPLISRKRNRSVVATKPGSKKRGSTTPARGSFSSRDLSPPSKFNRTFLAELIAMHLDPVPRLAAGEFLSRKKIASSGMDISDGLSLDLWRLCEAGGVGALVMTEAIPISHAARSWTKSCGKNALEIAMHGGEDYELLFTAPRSAEKKLQTWDVEDGSGPILIGRVKPRSHGLRLQDPHGRTSKLIPSGYDAFRSDRGEG